MDVPWTKQITVFEHYGHFLACQWTLWRTLLQVTCHYQYWQQSKQRGNWGYFLALYYKNLLKWSGKVRNGILLLQCTLSVRWVESPLISSPTAHKSLITNKIPPWELKYRKNRKKTYFKFKNNGFLEGYPIIAMWQLYLPHPLLGVIMLLTFLC